MNKKLVLVFSILLFIMFLGFTSPVSALTPEEREARRAVRVEKMREKLNTVTRSIAGYQEKYCDEFLIEWPELAPIWFCDIEVEEPIPAIPETGLVISEVYFNVASDKGSDSENEWIELYNGMDSEINVSGYKVVDNSTSTSGVRTLPDNSTIPARSYVVIITNFSPSTTTFWDIPINATIIILNNTQIGSQGLSNTGDQVFLRNISDELVDSVSWGTNTVAFGPLNPSAIPAPAGFSISRSNIKRDTNTYKDWIIRPVATPGK